MRCNGCSYPLWNITARQCPECGKGFNPGEYEFTPGLVQFCCPACNQVYYGTDARGQMLPPEFACAGCGQPMSAAAAVVRIKPGVRESETTLRELPWIERSRLGFWRGWWETFKLSITSPRVMMRRTPPQSSWVSAAWYSLLSILMFMAPQVITVVVIFLIAAAAFAGGRVRGGMSLAFAGGTGLFVLLVAGSMLASLLLWIVAAHATLRLTGAVHGSMRRTAHALCYSTGANFIVAVPLLGLYLSTFASIYWLALAAVMLTEAQRVQWWRAVLAAVILPVLLGLGVLGVAMAGLSAATTAATAQAAQGLNTARFLTLGTTVMVEHAQQGAWPAHALDLRLVAGGAMVQNLVLEDDDVVLPGVTAGEMMSLGADAQRARIDAFTASLPARVLAVRVGRVVTVYHGIEGRTPQAGLWLLLRIDEEGVEIVSAPGPRTRVSLDQFERALGAQNGARAAAGLPPLPESVIDLKPGEHIAWPAESELADDAGVTPERPD